MSDDSKNLLGFFCRHLVGLFVTYRHKTAEETDLPSRFAPCSGTLIILNDSLFFLTAGHVLRALDELRKNTKVEIEDVALADVFADARLSDRPIPFDLKNAELIYIDNDELGLDFGLIPIGRHHARLLAKNGVKAITAENWEHQHKINFDGYVMLGFPTELASERVSEKGDVAVTPVVFAVKRIEPSTDSPSATFERFVGQVSPKIPLKSIEGMSGGLIIGVKKDPQSRYWIVGVQSAWRPDTRIVYACPLSVLGSIVLSIEKHDAA